MNNSQPDSHAFFHFQRPRLNKLFSEAIKYPLVLICAGAGYGKTSAVHDFTKERQVNSIWIHLSERDNIETRFWENYTNTLSHINAPFAKAIGALGFPDTIDKLNQYYAFMHDYVKLNQRIIVFDDFHAIENSVMLRFIERSFLNVLPGTSVFLISRSTPQINVAGHVSSGRLFTISENDLCFTENELTQYFRQLEITHQPDRLREIMQDTMGWAFAINLIARSYQKAPGYGGYLRSALKTNVFRLMEAEIWDNISGPLQIFLIRLSLINHLSMDLIALLAGADQNLITGMEKQSAYVRSDSNINAYLIHPLFLEFLTSKQELLSEEQKRETFVIAAEWCNKNGFMIDALTYHEKVGDYTSIVNILSTLPAQIPESIARYAAEMLDRAPAEAFDTVEFLAVLHLRSYMCQGLWQKSTELAEYYEARFLKLPENSLVRKRTLSRLYFNWSFLRALLCTMEDRYDFDIQIEKFCSYLSEWDDPVKFPVYTPGPWINRAGSSRKGAPQEYIDAKTRMSVLLANRFNGFKNGEDELAKGELKFFQGDMRSAEIFISRALAQAREYKQFGIAHSALFYILRLNTVLGNYRNVEYALKEMTALLDESEYSDRYINYDMYLSWYYCILDLPEKISDWFKEDFSSYSHTGFMENFANQIKAWYCYMTRNFIPILLYIEEMKQRESFLFGRIEMLALEACIHYKMKEKNKAGEALLAAYEAASPNDIVIPFIELGKDMRTLSTFALKEFSGKIPKSWLEDINRKSSLYARHRSHIISKYKQINNITDGISFSARETEILTDLSRGLSRAEIAVNRNLSINTVKMVINMVYSKMGVENLADLIRIAVEQGII